jgi:type III secretion system (T3SS) SseB-like protein
MAGTNGFGDNPPNAALLRAMDDVSMHASEENWSKLYNELLVCKFIVPVQQIPPDAAGAMDMEEGQFPVAILQARDNSGKLATLVFTDVEALRDWNAEVAYVEMPARDLFQAIKDTEISAVIINLHRPDQQKLRMGGRITRFEFLALAEGMIPGRPDSSGLASMSVPEGMNVYVTAPEKAPSDEVLRSAAATAGEISEVRQLYLFQMMVPGGEAHNVLGIELMGEPRPPRVEEIMRTIAQSVNVLLQKNEYLDLLVLTGPLIVAVQERGRALI